ncbi:MAG: hypothetical protein WCG06_02145, partial [Candidatus Omnitrophota bacterium]
KVGVLVTGGFHKQGISRILRDSRVSSLVLTPRIDDASKTRPYVTILTRKKADYEKTFSKPASKYQIMIGTLLDNAGAARIGPDQTRQLLEPMVASLVKNSADVSKALNRWMADYRRAWAAQARPNRHLSPAKVESVAMGLAAARLSATASAATLPVVERALEQIQIDKVITMDAQGNLNLSRVVSNEELFKDISTGELPVVIRQLSDWTTTAELTLSGSGTSAMTLEEKIQKLTYLAVAYRMLADLHVRAAKPEEAQKTFVKKMYTFQEQISKLLFEANVPEDLLKLEPTQKLESTIELDSAIRLDQMHGFAPDLVYLYWPILRNTLLMNIPVHVYPINQWSLREESQDGGIASRLMDTPPFTVKLFPEAEPVIRITFKDSSSDQTRDEHSISIGVDQAEDIFRGIEDPQHPFYSYRVVLKVLTLVGIAKSAATAKRDLEAFFKSQGGKGIHLVEENWAPNRSGTGGSQNAAMAILRVMITGLCGKTIQAGTAGILQLAYLTQYLEQSLGIRGGLQDSIASHKGGGLIFHFSGLDSPELDVIASLEGGRKMLDNILVDTILVDVRGEHEASKVLEDLTDGFYRRDRHFLESVQASRARMEKMQKILKGTHSDDDLMLKDPDGRYETDRQGRLIKLSREEMLKNLFVEDYYYFRQLYGFKNPELDRLYQDSELRKLTGTVKVRRRLASGGFEIIEINRIKAHGAEGNLLSIFGKPFQGREAIYRWWLGHRHGNGQAYFAGFASQGSTLIMKAGARLGETTMTDDTIHELALRIAVSGSPHDVILQPDPSTALVAKELTFLIKPNIARDEENLKKILRRLRNEQLYVAGAAVFDGAAPEMLVKIRQHYSRIYEYAYHGSAVMNRADKEKLGLIYDNERFVGAFGCPFAAVPVLGAFEAMNRFNLSQEQITALWSQTQQDVARYRTGRVDGINQIGPNLSVMVVRDPAINDGKPFFLVNGYYFDLIRPFLAPGNKTVALLLRQKVGARMSDLKTKRELLLGSSDPARAAEGSLRREAWMNQFRTIGAVTAAANGFHMNDSDLAAAREAKIWFGIDYLSTRLGLLLYQYGYSRRDIEYLASADFMASSGVDLFQLTENMDSKQALAVIRSVWKPYYGDPLSPPALPTMSLTAYRRLARAHDRGRLNAGT